MATPATPATSDGCVKGRLAATRKSRDALAARTAAGAAAAAGRGPTKPSREIYTSIAARLGKVTKTGIFANAEPVRIDAKDALIEPSMLKDTATVDAHHHFVRHSGGRMD